MGNLSDRAYLLELRFDQIELAGPPPTPPPRITSVVPSSGPAFQMSSLTINGENFKAPLTVSFSGNGGNGVSTVVHSDTVITTWMASGGPGTYDATVTTPY